MLLCQINLLKELNNLFEYDLGDAPSLETLKARLEGL